jgi:hypothetical protein
LASREMEKASDAERLGRRTCGRGCDASSGGIL